MRAWIAIPIWAWAPGLAPAAPASEAAPVPVAPVSGESSLNVFNPTVSVFLNGLWRLDNKDVYHEHDGEIHELDDRFLLRAAELDFRAAVDPFADAVLIIGAHKETPDEYEIDVEEGYVVVKSLPFGFWEAPPLGTEIKAGRFLTSTGILCGRRRLRPLPPPLDRRLGAHPPHPYWANF
jgi:hypothetical protein